MLCTKCGKSDAIYHNSSVIDGMVIDEHLCGDCINGGVKNTYFNPIITNHCCKTCGCTFDEFSRTGLLGCSDCYNNFREELNPIINKLQGSIHHYGKNNVKDLSEEEKEYMELKKQLQQAVSLEDYELASALKEQILKFRDM